MIAFDNYKELESRFGNVSSWTVWAKEPEDKKFGGFSAKEIFPTLDLCTLNTGYVFAVSFATKKNYAFYNEGKEIEIYPNGYNSSSWRRFHMELAKGNEFLLRQGTNGEDNIFRGSYITSVVKYLDVENQIPFEDLNGVRLSYYIQKNPGVLDKNLHLFEEELQILRRDMPDLKVVALGRYAREMLSDFCNTHMIPLISVSHFANITYGSFLFDIEKNIKQESEKKFI